MSEVKVYKANPDGSRGELLRTEYANGKTKAVVVNGKLVPVKPSKV